MNSDKQKLHCYLEESGQDAGSEFFVVVVLVSEQDQILLKEKIIQFEKSSGVKSKKWHKTRITRNMKFLEMIMEYRVCVQDVYFGYYKKPIPYFLTMLDMLEKAILDKARNNYRSVVYVGGIDRKKSPELTNALRVKNIRTGLVRSVRDESEPLIRLVDRWAGCIRAAFLGRQREKDVLGRALEMNYFGGSKNPDL